MGWMGGMKAGILRQRRKAGNLHFMKAGLPREAEQLRAEAWLAPPLSVLEDGALQPLRSQQDFLLPAMA